jgi:hypothetical protein
VAYRADIEIAVRGAQELKRLQNEISTASRLVNQLNQYIETFGGPAVVRNVKNLRDTVGQAAAAFNEAALSTDEATIAAKKYINATAELNAGLRERQTLLQNITEQERKARLARSGITETTQYGGPIGPGQASPVALSSRAEGRIQNILQERQGRSELNAVLEAQFEKERQLQNSRLDEKAAQVQMQLDKQAAATAETAAQTAKLNARTREFTARTDAAARAARAQTAEYLRQQRVLKGLRKTQATSPAGGFPVEGPMASPGFKGMQKSVGKFGENLALGAGFPLLFGGGPGAVAGSVLGSFVGTGFGGQILGGAIGQVLDQTLIKIQTIGNALKTLNFDALSESGIKFNAEIKSQLDLLLSVGDALTAQKIASQEIAKETGTLPGVTEDVASSVNILGESWRKVVNAVSTTAGIIAAPLAVALAGILEAVNVLFRTLNTIFSLIGKGIKTAAEFVIQLVGGQAALDFINAGIDRLNSGLAEAAATAAEFRNTLNQSVVRSAIELEATRGLTPGVTTADKVTNIKVQAQKDLNNLFQDEVDARIKIRQENSKASAETVAGLIKQNDALFKNKRESIEINAERQITAEVQREQADLERKAAQELEKQRKELERIAKLRLDQLNNAQKNYVLAEAEIGVLTSIGAEAKAQAEYEKVRIQRMYTFAELLQKALSEEEKEALLQTQYLEALAAEIKLDTEILGIQKRQTAELYAQLDAAGLLDQQLQKRLGRGAKADSLGTQDSKLPLGGFTPGMPQLAGDRGAKGKIEDRISQLKEEVKELTNIGNIAIKVADGIGAAFSTAFQGLVSGSMTAKEALSTFFKSVGDMFIEMAAEIIAKQTVMITLQLILKALGAIAGAAGGPTGAAGSKGYTLPKGGGFAEGFKLPPILGKAVGGPVANSQPYFVGERGPELFVPNTAGTIMPTNELRSAMGASGGSAAGPVLNMSFETTNIGGVEYVSRDQLEAAMASTRRDAARDGAKRGMSMTLDKLQQSPGTRGRVGLR